MSFDSIEYLHLAQQLINKPSQTLPGDEAKQRSAINRAYYATFLKAKEYLDYNTNLKIPRDGTAHTLVRDIFKRNPDGKWRKIGLQLETLLQYRTKADYNDSIKDLAKIAEVMVDRAAEAIKRIGQLN